MSTTLPEGMVLLDCLECDKEFGECAFQYDGAQIICPCCLYQHRVATDIGDDGEIFWYLGRGYKKDNQHMK